MHLNVTRNVPLMLTTPLFQLPPSLTLNPKRRVIEKYKRALFTRHIGSVNLKNEIKKLMEASKEIVDLSFSSVKSLGPNDSTGG